MPRRRFRSTPVGQWGDSCPVISGYGVLQTANPKLPAMVKTASSPPRCFYWATGPPKESPSGRHWWIPFRPRASFSGPNMASSPAATSLVPQEQTMLTKPASVSDSGDKVQESHPTLPIARFSLLHKGFLTDFGVGPGCRYSGEKYGWALGR